MNVIFDLFDHYGYIVLLISLMLELIALPLPGETLMTYCGYVVHMDKLNFFICVFFATTGTIIGITFSYFIGRILEVSLVEKHGRYIHLNKKNFDKFAAWFNLYGAKLLIASYFIPGVRHITGYFAGMTKISYRKFAISAYSGALIWTFTFITLGKFLGSNWEKYHSILREYLGIIILVVVLLIIILYILKKCFPSIQKFLTASRHSIIKLSNSSEKKVLF